MSYEVERGLTKSKDKVKRIRNIGTRIMDKGIGGNPLHHNPQSIIPIPQTLSLSPALLAGPTLPSLCYVLSLILGLKTSRIHSFDNRRNGESETLVRPTEAVI